MEASPFITDASGPDDSLRFIDWLVEGNDKLIFFYFLISVWKNFILFKWSKNFEAQHSLSGGTKSIINQRPKCKFCIFVL